jgi:amino acid transporter
MSDTAIRLIEGERGKLKRSLTVLPLFGLLYFVVCGGAFGSEAIVGFSGPGMALLLLIITPLTYSIPSMLMVRELSSMMPAEGGYYHWVKQAFGPFTGFLVGWLNLVVYWVDVSIYPVLAVTYLGYFVPALNTGLTIGGVEISGSLLSWLVALVLIWGIVLLQIRGARLTGLTTDWLGVFMMIPLIIMSGFGIYNWIQSGATLSLPFLPEGETLGGALSVGLFVAMWNFAGWEVPSSAGDEIVNPRRTYPLAMALVLVATFATYSIPMVSGLYGGAGEGGRYQLWGIEELETEEGIGPAMEEYGVTAEQLDEWGVDASRPIGWEYPEIAHAIGVKTEGTDGRLARILGSLVTLSAFIGMSGLFIGNSLGASRLPFAMAEDGMMPKWMVKVHPKYGTPWVAILVSGMLFSLFSLGTFAFLIVVDVFMDCICQILDYLALWKLRFSHPHVSRQKVPGGIFGLGLITVASFSIIILAIISQISEEGFQAIGLGLAVILVGVLLYFPVRKFVKPGVPDVNPWEQTTEEETS